MGRVDEVALHKKLLPVHQITFGFLSTATPRLWGRVEINGTPTAAQYSTVYYTAVS